MAAIAFGLLALAALAGVGRPEGAKSAATDEQAAITVVGTGTVETVPDEATFSFGVVTKGRTASEALSANAAEAQRVIAALVRAGVERKDLHTDVVSLSPRVSDNGETILGYSAENSVSATIRDLARAGAVVDAAVGAGANQVSGPALAKANQDRLYRDAWDQKPPAIFLSYLAAFTIFGWTPAAIAWLDLIASAATAWLMFLTVRRTSSE